MATEELGTGDCEDFAILKYSTLLQLGIPERRFAWCLPN